MMANHEETKLVDTNSKCNEDFCLMATTANIDDKKLSEENWFADSGDTVHITNNDEGMINVKKCEFKITVGDGHSIKCEKMGDLKILIKQNNSSPPLLLKM